MPGVALDGTSIYYNGYEFPVTVEPPRITIEPVYDSAGRVVVACRFTFNISTIVFPYTDFGEANTNTQMALLRVKLSEPAKELRVIGTGFSDFTVNTPGGRVWDMEWGPKPKVVSLRQVGDNQAWKLDWQVTACVPEECPESTHWSLKRIMEWCYSVQWDVDEQGLTTRTVTGHVMIPLTREPGNPLALPDHADRLREAVKDINTPEGFRRIPGPTTLSEDRRRLDFTITDKQFESIWSPPPGVTVITGSHSMNNYQAKNWLQWLHSVNVTITMGRDQSKADSWFHFGRIWRHRAFTRQRDVRIDELWLPLTLSVNETMYSMTTSFRMDYIVTKNNVGADFGPQGFLKTVLRSVGRTSGMWSMPPDHTWLTWHASLRETALHSRGYAKLEYFKEDDKLINVCVAPPPTGRSLLPWKVPPNPDRVLQGRIPGRGGNIDPKEDNAQGNLGGGGGAGNDPRLRGEEELLNRRIEPRASFLMFNASIRIIEEDDVARLKVLPDSEVQPRRGRRTVDSDRQYEPDYDAKASPPFVFQYRAEPGYLVVYEGKAVRAGYSIDRPRLEEVGGQKAYPVKTADDYFQSEVVGNFLTPIVAAKWRLTYAMENTPKKPIGTPGNVLYGSLDGSADPQLDGFTSLPD